MKILFCRQESSVDLPAPHVLHICAAESKYEISKSKTKSIKLLQTQEYDVFVCNKADHDLFQAARNSGAITVLVTMDTIYQFSVYLKDQDHELVDHVVGSIDERWLINELRVTLQKIITRDIFGISFYLRPKTHVITHLVRQAQDRQRFHTEVSSYLDRKKAPPTVVRHCYAITEELLMNALFDAPAAAGKNFDKDHPIPPELAPQIEYGFDGQIVAVSARDPYGSFPKEVFFNYLRKALYNGDSEQILDEKTEGAGIGLFKILSYCHGVICNQSKGVETEVIALIDCEKAGRNIQKVPRSIHYFDQNLTWWDRSKN